MNCNLIYKKSNKYIKVLFLISFLLLFLFLICSFFSKKIILNDVLNLIIIILPINSIFLLLKIKKIKKDYSYIDTIVTTENYSNKIENKFLELGVKIKRKVNDSNNIIRSNDLEKSYKVIDYCQKRRNWFLILFNYYFISSSLLGLFYILCFFTSFRSPFNIYNVLIIKLFYILLNYFLLHVNNYDEYNDKQTISWFERIMIVSIRLMIMLFFLSIPFMYISINTSNYLLANTVFFITYIFISSFYLVFSFKSKFFILNLKLCFYNYALFSYLVYSFLLTLIFLLIKRMNVINIGFHNYISCLLISLVCILILDVFKLIKVLLYKYLIKRGS